MKRAAVVLKVLLLVVVLAFVASTAWDLGQQWQRAPPVRLASGWLVVSVLPVAGVSLCQAVGWRSLLVRLAGRSLPWLASIELLLASMLGRYAPAKVGMPAILMSRAEQLTLTPAVMASSMVLNVLVYSLLGVGLGGLAMAAAGAQGSIPGMPRADVVGGLALAATVGAIAVLLTVDRRRLPAMVLRVLGVQGSGPLIGVPVVGWTTVVWTCWWVHGVVLVMAVGGSVDDGVRTAWLFVLAPVIGFLATVSPGGLGVREAVVAMGLTPVVGAGPAVAAALLSRAASLSMDIAMWIGFRAALRRSRRRREVSPPDPRPPA